MSAKFRKFVDNNRVFVTVKHGKKYISADDFSQEGNNSKPRKTRK